MLEVVILRVLLLQAINRRTPCSPWIPVSPKLSGRPCKATYHHGPPTCTHWAATGCHCHGDPPQLHGPYLIWTRKVDNKTVTRTLDTTQADALRPLMENSRRLR